jgi:predicted small integral membrane protein
MLEWMYWTIENVIVVALVFFMPFILGVIDYLSGAAQRKGWLPYPTSRGDRVFLSVLFSIAIGILWLHFLHPYVTMWGAFIVALVVGTIIIKKA